MNKLLEIRTKQTIVKLTTAMEEIKQSIKILEDSIESKNPERPVIIGTTTLEVVDGHSKNIINGKLALDMKSLPWDSRINALTYKVNYNGTWAIQRRKPEFNQEEWLIFIKITQRKLLFDVAQGFYNEVHIT